MVVSTVADVLPPLPNARTKDAALDALLARIERGDMAAAGEVTPAWAPRVLARLEQATQGIGALQELEGKAPELFAEVWRTQEPRRCAIEMLSRALGPHLAVPRVEATLADLFATHPWHLARLAVGRGLLAGEPTRSTLTRVAEAMDDESLLLWVRHTGIAAAVRLDPSTAFDRLAARFEPEIAKGTGMARGLFVALAPEALRWPAPAIDPRFYRLLARTFETDGVIADTFFATHPVPAAVVAAVELLDERTATRAPWLLYLGTTFIAWKKPETVPALMRAVASAIDTADARLSGPLGALEAIRDTSVVPSLRELAERAAREAQPALQATIASLAGGKAGKPKRARATRSTDERASLAKALATRLSEAGLVPKRVQDLVALARTRIRIAAKYTKSEPPLGNSRLGGAPDVPAGFAWPHVGGEPLSFVGQLALAELAPHDLDRLLPRGGLLSFFARQEVEVESAGDLAAVASRVVFFEDAKTLVRAAFPETLAPVERYRPALLRFAHDLPPPPPAVAARLGLVVSESRAYETLLDEPSERHAALGHARAAYYLGVPSPGEVLLFHVASDSAPGFLWGDESSIFFVIDEAALAARRFHEARCVADEG